MVLDAQALDPLGFSHIKVSHRPKEGPDRFRRNYKRQPITEKESYKWIEVALKSKRTLANGESLYRFVDAGPIAGTYTIELPADKRKDQFKREAKIALRFAECEIVRPANLKRADYPATMSFTCI